MTKFLRRAAALALLAAAPGCVNIQRADAFGDVRIERGLAPVRTVEIENAVWELFGFIPLVSGNPYAEGARGVRFFRDTATLANNMKLLEAERAAAGADTVANLTSHFTEESFLFIVLVRQSCHTSAVLAKSESEKKARK